MRLARFISYLFLLLFLNVKAFAFTDPNHVDDFDFSASETISTTVKFSPDGKTMFVIGVSSDTLRQYSLGTAFDLSSSPTLVDSKFIRTIQNAAQDIEFNSDGTIIYIIGTDGDDIDQWTLSSPYDIGSISTTASSKNINIGGDPRGLKFSNDGKKLFIVHQVSSAKGRVDEFTLTTPYDLDTRTKTNELTLSYTGIGGRRQGINFSSDGYKLFITNSATDASDPEASRNLIREYSLDSPFNISNPTNNGDFQPSYIAKFRLTGLTFNNDGSKMFHTDFTNHKVYEYTLFCAFGVKTCTDPTSDNDDVGSVEAQSSATKKLIQHTSYPVLNRMEWLRRNKDSVNLTNQNLKLQFSNEILASLSNLLMPSSLTNDNTSSNQSISTNWSYWSEGTISIGKVGDSLSSSAKSINTSAITIGADKKVDKDRVHGFALRFGNDDVKVWKLGSALDMNSLSLTIYETRPTSDNMFMDILLGASAIKTDLINNSGTVSTNGKRNGQQVFSSIKFRETFTKEKINFTPNIKLDLGLTTLSDYKEKGAEGLNLRFGRQNIGTIVSSLGSTIDNTININNGILKPKIQLQYNADLSPSSRQVFEYASNGTSYVIENINNSTHNVNGSFGFDLITNNGLSITSNYERSQNKGAGHTDAFYFAGKLSSRKDETYILSLDGIQSFNTKLDYKRSLNGFDITFSSNYNLTSLIPDYGANIEVSTNF